MGWLKQKWWIIFPALALILIFIVLLILVSDYLDTFTIVSTFVAAAVTVYFICLALTLRKKR